MELVKICPSCGLGNPVTEMICQRCMMDITIVNPTEQKSGVKHTEQKSGVKHTEQNTPNFQLTPHNIIPPPPAHRLTQNLYLSATKT